MDIMSASKRILPEIWRDTIFLRLFGLGKVPLIAFVRPRILEVNSENLRMLIPLRRRTKNHLGSMYFGSLMIGADVAAAYYAVKLIYQSGEKVDFVFKSSTGRFLKRPMGDVVFSCNQGQDIQSLVDRAIRTGERVDTELMVTATVPSLSPEVVAEMTMVLSLKKRKNRRTHRVKVDCLDCCCHHRWSCCDRLEYGRAVSGFCLGNDQDT